MEIEVIEINRIEGVVYLIGRIHQGITKELAKGHFLVGAKD